MKITLKKIQHSKFASHETNCFQADLYINGKPIAIVSNDGQGGCDMHYQHPKNPTKDFWGDIKKINEWCKTNHSFTSEHAIGKVYEGDLDIAVSNALEDSLIEKDVKSLMTRSMIVFEKGKKGFYKYGKKKYNITADRMGWFNNQMWQQFKDNWVCINNMPIDEAVAYYKSN